MRLRFRVIPSCDCAVVSMAVWSTATVSVDEEEEGSDGGIMGKIGAGWPRMRWAICEKDDVRKGFVCMSAVLSFP